MNFLLSRFKVQPQQKLRSTFYSHYAACTLHHTPKIAEAPGFLNGRKRYFAVICDFNSDAAWSIITGFYEDKKPVSARMPGRIGQALAYGRQVGRGHRQVGKAHRLGAGELDLYIKAFRSFFYSILLL